MLVQNRATSYNRYVESAEPAAPGTSQRSKYTTRDQSFRAPFLNGTPHTLTLIPPQLSAHERFGDYRRVAIGIDYHILLYEQLLRSL